VSTCTPFAALVVFQPRPPANENGLRLSLQTRRPSIAKSTRLAGPPFVRTAHGTIPVSVWPRSNDVVSTWIA
jgi:hypothetical protein